MTVPSNRDWIVFQNESIQYKINHLINRSGDNFMRGITGFRADPDSGDIDHSTDRCSAARQDRRIARQRINRLASRRARALGHFDPVRGRHRHHRLFNDAGEPVPADHDRHHRTNSTGRFVVEFDWGGDYDSLLFLIVSEICLSKKIEMEKICLFLSRIPRKSLKIL